MPELKMDDGTRIAYQLNKGKLDVYVKIEDEDSLKCSWVKKILNDYDSRNAETNPKGHDSNLYKAIEGE